MKIIDHQIKEFVSPEIRLDQYLVQQKICTSRSEATRLIKEGRVLLNQSQTRASEKPKMGDHISVNFPPVQSAELAPKNLNLNVVYEDEDILVLNKPAGLAVHPGAGNYDEIVEIIEK